MSQVSIDVQVFSFEREHAGQKFTQVKQKEYKTIIEDSHTYELPSIPLESDSKGNTLRYIACKVGPSAMATVQDAEPKKRSVVAKKPKNVVIATEPEPVVEVAPVSTTPQKFSIDAFLAALDA